MTQAANAIRRLDWRFLLGDVQLCDVVALGVDDDHLTGGLRQLGVANVDADAVGSHGAAVVFIGGSGHGDLDRAIELRAQYGTIVVESTTRRARRVVERRLRRAGLRVRSYGAWPDAPTATRFVPLDSRTELTASALSAKNPRRRAIGSALTRLGLGTLIFAESTSTAGAGDGSDSPAPLRVAFGDGGDADGTMTLLTPRFASSRHVIALATDRAGRELVVKTPRSPSDEGQLQLEARGLTTIAAGGPRRPQLVVDTERFGQRWLVQTRVVGEPLARRHVAAEPERWTAAAGRWLREMPTDGTSTPDDDGRSERLIRPALDVIADRATREPALVKLLADGERAFEIVRSMPLPIVCEHGDFRPPNLIVTGPDEIAAVDWELAERRGLPLHDLLFFSAYVTSVVTESCAPLRRSALDHLLDLGVESTMFEPLATVASLRHLANEATRLAGEADVPSRTVADSTIAQAWFEALVSERSGGDQEVAPT